MGECEDEFAVVMVVVVVVVAVVPSDFSDNAVSNVADVVLASSGVDELGGRCSIEGAGRIVLLLVCGGE